jgi:uncharacterized cupin superfamily protein
MKTRLTAVAALIVACALAPQHAPAQQAGINAPISSATTSASRDASDPGARRLRAGAAFPRHSHPGEELVYVIEGTLEYTLDDKPPVTLKAGQVL